MIETDSFAGAIAPAVLKEHRAMALDHFVRILQISGRYSEALPPLEENLTFSESIGDSENVIRCLSILGEIYCRQGLPERALA